jgi:hypothetical protein
MPDYVSLCIFGSAVGYIPIQNVKNLFARYFTLLLEICSKVQLGMT